MATWTDPQTKRTIRQLTDFKGGARLGYFRMPRHLPGGWVLIHVGGEDAGLYTLDVESGETRRLHLPAGAQYLKLYSRSGRLWLRRERELWAVDLAGGKPELIAKLPAKTAGAMADVTCDGRTLILLERHQDLKKYPVPTTMDLDRFWHYFSRPRTAVLSAFDIASGRATRLVETDGVGPDHVDCSPVDPGLVRYCLDMYDAFGQRIWTVRTDGSEQRKIRPQERGELVTHEFWWADPELIGFTYQDRRQDPTLHEKPWAEYSPCPTHLGLARVRDGKEVYLSRPLNSYHSHLSVSPDGRWVCGEGTDGDSFAYAAPFSLKRRRIEMKAMAAIHTPYVPFRGQMVDAGFSADSKWLLFNDTMEGRLQVCACEV
jgi:sugar lactone lactonase YvrE